MSASRNIRLAWIAQELAKGRSRASIVIECMDKFKGVSEKTARKDLKEILQRITEIDNETLAEARTHILEVGWTLMNEARSLAQMGPAVNQYKNICALMGLLNEKAQDQSAPAQGVPDSTVIRERIAQLMKSKKIKEQAEAAGIDLEDMKE